jgi:hypothetical protein
LSPFEARDAAGFVASMQQLKERTGLTYRELEELAARSGDVLPRSTLAGILRRTSLPRPDLLAAFVRACGEGRQVGAWLDARERIAAAPATAPGTGPDAGATAPGAGEPTASRRRRTGGRAIAIAASLILLPLGLVAWGLLPDGSDAPSASAPAGGWVTIRPARTPEL